MPRLQDKMYYAVRSDHIASMLIKGIPLQALNDANHGVMLFYELSNAEQRCSDCFGEDPHVFEVSMKGFTSDMLDNFSHIRNSDTYIVFGEHTFLTLAIPSERLKLM